MIVESVCISNTGKLRNKNEDNVYFNGRWLEQDNSGLKYPMLTKVSTLGDPIFAVCDGMGGENAGEVASYITVSGIDYIRESYKKKLLGVSDYLKRMTVFLNEEVFNYSVDNNMGRIGSTLATMIFRDNYAYVCNVGDSRIFRLRNNSFLQMSVDDVENLPQNAKHKPRLTQHIGMDPNEIAIEPHISKSELKRGDIYLICSDGVTDMLTNVEIYNIIKTRASIKSAVEEILLKSLENGGRDNISAVICRIR